MLPSIHIDSFTLKIVLAGGVGECEGEVETVDDIVLVRVGLLVGVGDKVGDGVEEAKIWLTTLTP